MDEEQVIVDLAKRIEKSQRSVHNLNWFVLPNNLFAIAYGDGYLLFAPLQGVILLLTKVGLASLLLYENNSLSDVLQVCATEIDPGLIKALDTQSVPPKFRIISPAEFAPTGLILSPTAACQLACQYCYIRGGDTPRHMPWPIAERAIRFVINNCSRVGEHSMRLLFHGQGEPTANWRLFRDAVLFANAECQANNIKPKFSVVTNGILSESQVAFLAEHRFGISISLDSMRESTDQQRPMRGGGSTFDHVINTMRWLDTRGVEYSIRSTVTPRTVNEMSEFVTFIGIHSKCKTIQFEPLCMTGRAERFAESSPSLMTEFADAFGSADTRALATGMSLDYSGARVKHTRTSFCGAHGEDLNFIVSTEGLVSSCTEVLYESDPRAEVFIYGRYDQEKGDFCFDTFRLARLLSLSVNDFARCRDCFIKWHCAGDCLAKAALTGFQHLMDESVLERCAVNRVLARRDLFKRVLVG